MSADKRGRPSWPQEAWIAEDSGDGSRCYAVALWRLLKESSRIFASGKPGPAGKAPEPDADQAGA